MDNCKTSTGQSLLIKLDHLLKLISVGKEIPNIFDYVNLVGGFNPFEKYLSKWTSSPSGDEHKKYLETPPRNPTPIRRKMNLR